MNNKFLIGVITVFAGIIFCIIILNFTSSENKKDYFFERSFSESKILNFEKKYEKMCSDEYVRYIFSDDFIVENDKKSKDDNFDEYTFYYTNLDFSNQEIKKLILPKNINVILFNKTKLFYTLRFELYEYNYDTNISRKINLNKFKAFSLKRIPNTEDKFLCFGESFNGNKYTTGFHVIDFKNDNSVVSKSFEVNNISKMPENELRYSGKFCNLNDNGMIAYCCDKYSRIYFFNQNGVFIKELKTKDNSPLPEILKNDRGDSFYSRGGTWVSNFGLFVKNDNVFVFSGRTNEKLNIVIDKYSFSKLSYENSYRLNYNNLDSRCIKNVFEQKNKIILGFEFYYASFTFSRYI